MTRTRYRIFEDSHPYFTTCTIVGWLALFTRPEAVQIVFDSWRFLKQEKGFCLYGYVVLENHLHPIASAPELSNAIKSFKMHTAGTDGSDHRLAVRLGAPQPGNGVSGTRVPKQEFGNKSKSKMAELTAGSGAFSPLPAGTSRP
jgi:hypothetical protein